MEIFVQDSFSFNTAGCLRPSFKFLDVWAISSWNSFRTFMAPALVILLENNGFIKTELLEFNTLVLVFTSLPGVVWVPSSSCSFSPELVLRLGWENKNMTESCDMRRDLPPPPNVLPAWLQMWHVAAGDDLLQVGNCTEKHFKRHVENFAVIFRLFIIK